MATTRPTERKIRQPSDFDGNRDDAQNFLLTCRTYLRLNKDLYTTDEEKIIFIISFMVGGSAGPFKDALETEAYSIDPTTSEEKGFGTLKDFIKKFKEAFEPLNPVETAINKMKALQQTGTADDYISAFRPLAIRSGITTLSVLVDYFLSGLSAGLVRDIMRAHTLPSDIDGYYKLAAQLDLQWRKGNELTKAKRPATSNTTSTATTTKQSSSVKLRKLTDDERAKLRKEGRCFRCREVGHVSFDCPQRNKTNQGTQGGQQSEYRRIRVAGSAPPPAAQQAEPDSAIGRVRALFATLTPAEKEQVVNIGEAEGF